MISRTRIRGFNEPNGSWKTICIRARKGRKARSSIPSISRPSKNASPPVAGISFNNVRPTVVLPLPLSPTRPTVFPAGTEKLMSSTAFTQPLRWRNHVFRPRTSNKSATIQEPRQRTRRRRDLAGRGEADLVRLAARFHRFFEGGAHARGVGGDGDGGIHQHARRAHLHGFGGLAGRAKPGVDDDRHGGLFDDDLDLRPGLDAAIAPDGRTERHDRGGSRVL